MAEADSAVVTRLDAAYCIGLLPRRDPQGHKGTFGTVLCVAGSLGYLGAAILTTTSSARGGAGLVALVVPSRLQSFVAGRVPEVVTIGLQESTDGSDIDEQSAFGRAIDRHPDCVVFGPGIDETEGYRLLLLRMLADFGGPMVIDGGGLNLLARSPTWWTGTRGECVLTPHPGEFERLTGTPLGAEDSERQLACAAAASRFRQVVVLKGAQTVIAGPDGRMAVSPFANPALATAGSGDVLAGLIGALLAQGVSPFDAACLGVYLHGRAGERLAWRFGDAGLIASDLPLEIALARHELSAHSS